MFEKTYVRFLAEKLEGPDEGVIKIINVPEAGDVFTPLAKRAPAVASAAGAPAAEKDVVLLSEILADLHKKGVRRVILFDFSCAEIEGDTERGTRMARREARREGRNGGKRTRRKKRYLKKTKTRGTKKRRLQWSP